MVIHEAAKKVYKDQQKDAPRAVLEELFQDYYKHRKRIYWMNLIRGVFFGFGTVLGGTILVAVLLWVLSLLHYIPFLDGVVETFQNSLQERGQ